MANESFLLEFWRAEVEQDGKLKTGSGQVIDGLGAMCIVDFEHCFEFEDDFAINDKIGTIFANQHIFVVDWKMNLFLEGNAAQFQLMGKRCLVNGF